MRRVLRPFLILLALIFLFEAWLWERLAPIVGAIVAIIPWARFKIAVAAAIEALPPYPTLLVFLIPILLLLPLKFLAVFLLVHGHWLGTLAVLALAKVTSLGVTAFIFDVTRPKLLQLPWFRWLYDHVMLWLALAHGLIDPVKRRLKVWIRVFAPKRAGRAFRLLARIRRRMAARAAT